MDKISCNVINCSHNSNSICYADKVIINGNGSHESENTCCSSFIKCSIPKQVTDN